MHINAINNGMGAPSMYMMVLAAQGKIDADICITADTGSENDCLLSNGNRVTAQQFYTNVIEPLGLEFGINTAFIRTLDKNKQPLPPLIDRLRNGETAGVPLYGSNGGRLPQGCTSKYKVRAVRQELRRRGAKTATSYLGLTMDEVHRMKQHNDVKWHDVSWPLIRPYPMYKGTIRQELNKMNIPYMVSSQCDMCPHMNYPRWSRLSPETIEDVANIERAFGGNMFFSDKRKPLLIALEEMKNRQSMGIFDACDSGYCFT